MAPIKKEINRIEKEMAEVSAQKEKAVARFETVTEPTQIVRLQKEVAHLENSWKHWKQSGWIYPNKLNK